MNRQVEAFDASRTDAEDNSAMDPVAIGAGAAAKAVGDDSGKLLSRVLGPTADVIGQWLADQVEFRLRNTWRIVGKASAKPGLGHEGQVPPRVAHQILDDGSFCDDELMAEYLGGVLAASKTPGGRDDRGIAWSGIVNSMSALEVRAHFLLYRAWDELLLRRPDLNLWKDLDRAKARLFVEELEFVRVLTRLSDVTGSQALAHAFSGLERRGLIENPGWGSPDWVTVKGHGFEYVVTAVLTLSGLELYGWALGFAGLTPENYGELVRGQLDPALPRLTAVQFENPVGE